MSKIFSLFKVEFKRMFRSIDVVVFVVMFPIGMALILGAIYGDKLAYDGANYTMYQLAFSSFISIAICATGLMGLPLNVSDYRDKKILKKYKATPISPLAILISQILNSFIVAIISALIVFFVAKFVFGFYFIGSIVHYMLTFLFVTVSIYSIGMLIASVSPNYKVAGILTSIIYFPTIFLSGTTVPYNVMPGFLQKISDILPMTQGIKLLEGICVGKPIENVMMQIIIMSTLAIICSVVSIKVFKWE